MKMDNDVIYISSESESDDEFEGRPSEKNPPKTSFESNYLVPVLSLGRVKLENPFDGHINLEDSFVAGNGQKTSEPPPRLSRAPQKKRGAKKKTATCSICNKKFVGMALYRRHMRSIHRSTNVVAAQRRPRVETKKLTQNQLLSYQEKMRTYECPLCKTQVSGRGPLSNHMMQFHGAKQYNFVTKCPVCYMTISRISLDGHLSKTHNTSLQQLSPFNCSKCDRVYQNFANLLHHENTAHGKAAPSPKVEPVNKEDEKPNEEEHKCPKCLKTFSSRNWLIRHGLDCGTKKKMTAFPCSWCPAVFSHNNYKLKHENKSCLLRPTSNKNALRRVSKPKSSEDDKKMNSKVKHEKSDRPQPISKKKVIRKKPKSSDNDEKEITRPARNPRKCRSSHFSYSESLASIQNDFRKTDRMPRTCKTRDISYVNESSSEMESPNEFLQIGDKPSGWVSNRTPGGVKMVYADKLCCSYCPLFLATVPSRILHEKIHTGETGYQCKYCKAEFRYPRKTLDHEKKCLDTIGSFWCPFCDYNDKLRHKVESHCVSFHQFDLINNKVLSCENTSEEEETSDDEITQENISPNSIQVPETNNIPVNDSEDEFPQQNIAANRIQVPETKNIISLNDVRQSFDRLSTLNVPRIDAQTFDNRFVEKNIPSNNQTFGDRLVTTPTKKIPSQTLMDQFVTKKSPLKIQTSDDRFNTKNIPSNDHTFDNQSITKNIPPQSFDVQLSTMNIPSSSSQTVDDRSVTKHIPPNHDHTYDQMNCNIKVEVEDKSYDEEVTVDTVSDNEDENIWSDFIIIDD